MAEKTFQFELITPDRAVFEGAVVSVSVPTGGGSIGILVNHAPLVSLVETGAVRVVDEKGQELLFMVGDGFLEVNDNHVRIMAEVGERESDIDLERAEKAEKRALERLKESVAADVDFERAKQALTRAMTRIKIVRSRHGR